jgi:hypothetical protein
MCVCRSTLAEDELNLRLSNCAEKSHTALGVYPESPFVGVLYVLVSPVETLDFGRTIPELRKQLHTDMRRSVVSTLRLLKLKDFHLADNCSEWYCKCYVQVA